MSSQYLQIQSTICFDLKNKVFFLLRSANNQNQTYLEPFSTINKIYKFINKNFQMSSQYLQIQFTIC